MISRSPVSYLKYYQFCETGIYIKWKYTPHCFPDILVTIYQFLFASGICFPIFFSHVLTCFADICCLSAMYRIIRNALPAPHLFSRFLFCILHKDTLVLLHVTNIYCVINYCISALRIGVQIIGESEKDRNKCY